MQQLNLVVPEVESQVSAAAGNLNPAEKQDPAIHRNLTDAEPLPPCRGEGRCADGHVPHPNNVKSRFRR